MASQADQAEADEVERLQGVLRQRHAELDAIDSRDAGALAAGRSRVFAATKALLEYEARLPRLRDERRRKTSSILIYATAGPAALLMLVQLALMLAGRVSTWYLIAVLPVGALAGFTAGVEHDQPVDGHRSRAAAAILILISAVLVAIVTARVLPPLTLGLLVFLLLVAAVCWLVGANADGGEAN